MKNLEILELEREIRGLQLKKNEFHLLNSQAETRLAILKEMIGKAKRREEIQESVSEVLDIMQNEIHQKNIGVYEDLMSAFIKDVLNSEKNVKLTSGTELGAPSLDIDLIKTVNKKIVKESILDGSGGSVVNILSAALRLLVLTKKKSYPFMLLDEPDCWIKPEKVTEFVKVLKDVASELEYQMLYVSHLSEASFGNDQVITMKKDGGKIWTENLEQDFIWEKSKKGIRWIKMKNLMSHEDTVLKLNPGFTILNGENDIGKSVVGAGLRALFYGESNDNMIKHGFDHFSIECEIHDGMILKFDHYEKKSPKRKWSLLRAEDRFILADGTPKRGVPDWVKDFIKIERIEGLDVHLTNQKSPVFLLNESASKRAVLMSLGEESIFLEKMIYQNKSVHKEDLQMIKDGEKEGSLIVEKMKILSSEINSKTDLNLIEKQLKILASRQNILMNFYENIEKIKKINVFLNNKSLNLDVKKCDVKLIENWYVKVNLVKKLKKLMSAQNILKKFNIKNIESVSEKIEKFKSIINLQKKWNENKRILNFKIFNINLNEIKKFTLNEGLVNVNKNIRKIKLISNLMDFKINDIKRIDVDGIRQFSIILKKFKLIREIKDKKELINNNLESLSCQEEIVSLKIKDYNEKNLCPICGQNMNLNHEQKIC